MAIKIPRKTLAEIITHALEDDPNECCGFLLGKGDEATRSRRAKNVHKNQISRYSMDPVEVMEIQQDADGKSETFVAIYHSHTYTQGYPSETDVNNAVDSGWIDPYYVLVSLVEKTRPVVRAYRIHEDRRVEEIAIVTDGQAYRGANG